MAWICGSATMRRFLEMVKRICFRKGWLGNALAEGGILASEKIGKNSFDYLIQVKGVSNLHSDERATPGLALNICHGLPGLRPSKKPAGH